VKLVNGRPTKAIVDVANNEAEPISLSFVGGGLYTLQDLPADAHPSAAILSNLSVVTYQATIPAGERQTVPYSFVLDMQPQDVRLMLSAVLTNKKGELFQVPVTNQTVSIVEAPTSIFDPQM
jgi:hypothetical protein